MAEGKGVDGIGLAAVALGSAVMYAGVKGYSVLAVLENFVTGRPIKTNVNMVHKLTVDVPVSGALGGAIAGGGENG